MRKFNSEKLGVTKEYKRQLYVDSAKMNRFKQSQFNGKKRSRIIIRAILYTSIRALLKINTV